MKTFASAHVNSMVVILARFLSAAAICSDKTDTSFKQMGSLESIVSMMHSATDSVVFFEKSVDV